MCPVDNRSRHIFFASEEYFAHGHKLDARLGGAALEQCPLRPHLEGLCHVNEQELGLAGHVLADIHHDKDC